MYSINISHVLHLALWWDRCLNCSLWKKNDRIHVRSVPYLSTKWSMWSPCLPRLGYWKECVPVRESCPRRLIVCILTRVIGRWTTSNFRALCYTSRRIFLSHCGTIPLWRSLSLWNQTLVGPSILLILVFTLSIVQEGLWMQTLGAHLKTTYKKAFRG